MADRIDTKGGVTGDELDAMRSRIETLKSGLLYSSRRAAHLSDKLMRDIDECTEGVPSGIRKDADDLVLFTAAILRDVREMEDFRRRLGRMAQRQYREEKNHGSR